jgi:RNA polymerase sigma factor (sigma-70 family)
MPPGDHDRRLAGLLRARDEATWRLVETEVLPKVLQALESQFGPGRHWQDLSGAARSAERTALRRLTERADPKLEDLETLEQFEKWLVVVARNKFIGALRRAAVEKTHAAELERLLEAGPREELGRQAAAEVVRQLEASLSGEDRLVFQGKLAQKSQVAIAAELGCSTRTVTAMWQRIKACMLRQAAEDCA